MFDDTIAFANLGQYQVSSGAAAVPSTAVPKGSEGGGTARKSMTPEAVATTTWPLRRFTYDTESGTVTCALPSRLTEDTIAKLMVWLFTILQQIDRTPQEVANPIKY